VIDRRTGVLLASGKTTAWDGNVASQRFAKAIMQKLRAARSMRQRAENRIAAVRLKNP
jgi:hypothetical protein